MSDAHAARLALAQKHVCRGREIVAAQRATIGRLWLAERSTADAESLLRTFEDTLSIFEDDLRRFEEEAAGAGRRGSPSAGMPPRR